MSESCRYDLNRPYACQTHNTQWLDDDADQCEYKRMVVAEAATSAVRELHSPYLSANGLVICAGCGHRWGTCPTRAVMDGAS